MGKYEKVLQDLPKLRPEASEYQDRVELAKREFMDGDENAGFRPRSVQLLAEAFVKLRREKDKFEEQERVLNLRLEAVSQLVIEAYEAQGLQSIKMADGASVSAQDEPYPGVKDKESFRIWCLEHGMVKEMHLHPSTAASLIKNRLLNGDVEQCGACKGAATDIGNEPAFPVGEDGRCKACNGTGFQVAPGVTVYTKTKLVVRGRK